MRCGPRGLRRDGEEGGHVIQAALALGNGAPPDRQHETEEHQEQRPRVPEISVHAGCRREDEQEERPRE